MKLELPFTLEKLYAEWRATSRRKVERRLNALGMELVGDNVVWARPESVSDAINEIALRHGFTD